MRTLFNVVILPLLILLLLFIGFVSLANWHDEPLRDDVCPLLAYKAPTSDQLRDNGFLILAGMNAAPPANAKENPVDAAMAAGLEFLQNEQVRREWFLRAKGAFEPKDWPPAYKPSNPLSHTDVFPDKLRCREASVLQCHQWYTRQAAALRPLIARQQPMFARMQAAAQATQFADVMPHYLQSLPPPYQILIATHELQLAQASLLWNEGKQAQALDLLASGDSLTQRLAEPSNPLIASMIALAMQMRTLSWTSSLIASSGQPLHPSIQDRIRERLERPVISLRAGLNSERLNALNMLSVLGNDPRDWGDVSQIAEETARWPAKITAQWLQRTYLPNESMNRQMEWWDLFAPIADVSADSQDAEIASAQHQWEELGRQRWNWLGARNAAGKILSNVTMVDYAAYVSRRHDVEAYRRMVLIQWTGHAQHISLAQMPQWLQTTPAAMRNPYTLQPMQWDADAKSLIYEGRKTQTQNLNRSKTYQINF